MSALSRVLAYGSWDVLFDSLARIVVCARTTRQRGVGQRVANGPAFGGRAILPQLRERWEYGHVAAFIVWFCGVALLTLSIIADTPQDHRREASTK